MAQSAFICAICDLCWTDPGIARFTTHDSRLTERCRSGGREMYTSANVNTHTIYIVAMLACFFAAGVNAIWFGSELRRFLANTPSISTPLDMFRFKKVVAHQMYAALVQIVLLLAPIALFFLGVMTDALAPSDLLFVVVPSAVIIVIAISFKSLESQAKSIPTADSELEAQRDAVVQTWLRKPFPNW